MVTHSLQNLRSIESLLLANLLSPVGAGAFSQNLSQQEYTRLFERDRLGLSTFTEYRSDGQWRELATQSGQFGRFGYALDVDYQHNDGVRANNGLDRVDWYSTLKFQLSPEDTLLLLTKVQDYHSGDNFQYLFVTNARPALHYDNYQTPLLALGWHHEWSPESHTLAMAGRLENEAHITDKQAFHWLLAGTSSNNVLFISPIKADEVYRSRFEIWFSELNQVWHSGRNTLIAGGRAQTGTFDTSGTLSGFNPSVNYPIPSVEADVQEGFGRASVYAYDQVALLSDLALTAGVAYDSVTFPANFREVPVTSGQITRSEVLPKSALVWTPLPGLALRGMYAWSLSGASFDESFRLEPAALAGFPQSFRAVIPESVVGSVSGELLKVWGAAVDLKLASRTYLGLEADGWQSDVRRDRGGLFNTVIGQQPATLAFRENLDYSAHAVGVSVNELIGERWSAGLGWRWQQASLHPSTPELTHLIPGENQMPGPQRATLNEVWSRLQWQHPSGPFARADAKFLWQSHHAQLTSDSTGPILSDREYVSQIDLQAGWRFKHNRGELAAGVLNVGGGDYRLDPLSGYPELPHERVFFARLRLNF